MKQVQYLILLLLRFMCALKNKHNHENPVVWTLQKLTSPSFRVGSYSLSILSHRSYRENPNHIELKTWFKKNQKMQCRVGGYIA